MKEYIKENSNHSNKEIFNDEVVDSIISKFIENMDDDFNSVATIANLHTIFKYVNNLMKTAKKSNKQVAANTIEKMLKDIKEVYGILGLFEQNPNDFIEEMRKKYISNLNVNIEEIENRINERLEAKKNKDFDKADSIREELDKKGIILNDTIDGTLWDIKELY